MTVIYPYDKATYGLKLSNLVDNVFKLNGQSRKDALLQLQRYANKNNILYSDLVNLFTKNINFYQNEFAINNHKLTTKQVANKQNLAFKASLNRAVTQNYATNIKNNNLDKKFIWLPSSSKDPRDTHQQLYGKIFSFSNPPLGVLPGQDYNCKCGIKII